VPLLLDLRIVHDRVGSSADTTLNGHLKYPNNLDQSLNDTATDNTRKYRADYNNRPPSVVSFMPAIASTSDRLHSEFVRHLFLQDNENLLYLTDSEATLQVINKWIGGGPKLSLTKTSDPDVFRDIIVKLQQRVKAKAATLLIKVKEHRGCPLNEEADIRTEMGRVKQEKEKTWNTPTNRTIYQWSEVSKTKDGVSTTKQAAWTQAVRNRMRQKAGEIQAHRAYEKGAGKWRKEHMPKKGKGNVSAEGQELLEDKEIWGNETALRGVIHDSRKRERSNEDGVFMQHQRGPITSTFTVDWFLREGQGRELLEEWMKKTAVRSQDQRRMLQENSHTFPTNSWIHKITKGRESDRCDLCRTLWIAEGRFRTEEELPKQNLGHIQHTCEVLSAAHIDAHHQC
jgi:hypothetical protein